MGAIIQIILWIIGIVVAICIFGFVMTILSVIASIIGYLFENAISGCFTIIFWIIVVLCIIALII